MSDEAFEVASEHLNRDKLVQRTLRFNNAEVFPRSHVPSKTAVRVRTSENPEVKVFVPPKRP